MIERQHLLDKAIIELRKALHLQMELCHRRPYDIDMDAIDQAGALVQRTLEQVRLIMIPGDVGAMLLRSIELYSTEAEAMIRLYGLDKLPKDSITALLQLPPIQFDETE